MVQRLTEGEYFGRSIQKRKLDGFILTEKMHGMGDRLPKHAHENTYFCMVLNGNWLEMVNSRERSCKPMSLQYHPSGEVHADDFRYQAGHTFNIELNAGCLDRFRGYAVSLDDSLEFYKDKVTRIALQIYREFRIFDPVSPLVVEGLICELMASIVRQKAATPETASPLWLRQVKDLLDECFKETLALNDIANRFDIHPVHLARTFRRYYNCTIGDYQRQRRIEFTCRELSDPENTLVEIALSAGFYDQSHFTRTFKKIVGIPPATYRSLLSKS